MALINFPKKTKDQKESLKLAFRVLPVIRDTGVLNKSGTKNKKIRMASIEVMNAHLGKLDAQHLAHAGEPDKQNADFVYYSTDTHVDFQKAEKIDEIVFFSYTDQWAARCRVEVLTKQDSTPFIPADINTSNSVLCWANKECPTWIKIYNYEQIPFEELGRFRLVNDNLSGSQYLNELISNSRRFSRAYIEEI